ncbi:MAG: hypothetical protein NC400_13750 [Clostridium sp.]|nr:hypothetical protein [Clostridium sp.]
MKYPFFASFILFCLWLLYTLHRQRTKESNADKSFWEREAAANSTRRKPLDNLEYIQIPFDKLPMDVLADDPAVAEYHKTLRELADAPIVNFTGISNTDLKLMYGAPNIDILSRYDQRYTMLVRTLQNLAQALYDEGFADEACQILEFAVSTRTDISASYKLLAEIYLQKGQKEKISELVPIAEGLNTSLSKHIVSMLKELLAKKPQA